MDSTRQSMPTTSIAAWRRISSHPPLTKESRAPELAKPTVRRVPSTSTTWACCESTIQARRRRFLVCSRMSGHRRRTSTRLRPPRGPAGCSATGVPGAAGAVGSGTGSATVGGGCGGSGSEVGIGGGGAGPSSRTGAGASGRDGAGASAAGAVGTGGGGAGSSERAGAEVAAAGAACGAGAGAAGAGAAAARATAAGAGAPVTSMRRSRRSRRAITPSAVWSAPGSSTRAQSSSSRRRGAVAPRISVSPEATMSAARLSSMAPKRAAWATSRSPASSATSIRPVAGASGTAVTMTRSRRRRSRSSVKRRGSWPVSTTLSTTEKTAAPSRVANASTTSSSSESGVKPSRSVASLWVTPPGPAPPRSWSSTDSVSRADPAPARTTSGRAAGSMLTPSSPASWER